jgi:hypothetical protein
MKKIPTLFERDWNGDRSRVVDQVHEGCEWVIAGEGVATRKIDGTSCLVRKGELWKRRELRKGDAVPADFDLVDHDEETGKTVGWVPVGMGPEDKWHREAAYEDMAEGTYELVGPKIQGNPEGYSQHRLVAHLSCQHYPEAPRTFEGLKSFLSGQNIEGLVWHHPDGRMAKIKLRDFGFKRLAPVEQEP